MRPTVAALRSLLGLSEAEVRKLVLTSPPVLGYSIEENVRPTVAALRSLLGLSEAEVRKLVLRLPPVLGYSIEENVRPTVAALRVAARAERGGGAQAGAEAAVGAGLQRRGECAAEGGGAAVAARAERGGGAQAGAVPPSVLGYSVEENVRPTVAALRSLLGLSEAEVRKLVLSVAAGAGLQRRGECAAGGGGAAVAARAERGGGAQAGADAPSVLGYSIEENVRPKVAALRRLLGLSEAEVRKLVLRQPSVLRPASRRMPRPTAAALRQLFDLDEEEVRAAVLSCPHC